MKAISLINHSKGAVGLRFFGLGPNLKPTNGLNKLKKLLDRALTDGIYRGVLLDIVIDQNHQGKGYGSLIVKNLLSSKEIRNTKKLYLMTTNKKLFYSQFEFKEVTSQNLLIREI